MKTTPLGYSLASPSTDSPRPPRGCGGRLGGGEPCTMAIKGFAESAAAAAGDGGAVEERLRAIVEELKA